MLTKQEIFTKTINHMRAQGNPWGDYDKRGWTYVNPNNPCQRCAMGIHLDINLTNIGYRAHISSFIIRLGRYSEFYSLLLKLQNIFENIQPIHWESKFLDLAELYELELPPLTKQIIVQEEKINDY